MRKIHTNLRNSPPLTPIAAIAGYPIVTGTYPFPHHPDVLTSGIRLSPSRVLPRQPNGHPRFRGSADGVSRTGRAHWAVLPRDGVL